jgi:MFS family permease
LSETLADGNSPPLPGASGDDGPALRNPYGMPVFWMVFAAQLLLWTAQAVLFRYADFVHVLGGTDVHLGWIVGVGMVGSVVMRLSLGQWLDRYGPRRVWVISLAVLAGACAAHWMVTDCRGLPIYTLRMIFSTALAGALGAWTTVIVTRFSGPRMPEMLSILGTAGFLGMMLGAHLGDAVYGELEISRAQADRMFFLAALLAASGIPLAWGATRGAKPVARRRCLPLVPLLASYHPGRLLLVGVVAGAALTQPFVFLRPYAAELSIPHIGLFFTVSALTSVISRLVLRGLDRRLGLPRVILCGLGLMVVAQVLFLVAHAPWQLAVPGLVFGASQSILSPMVIAAGVLTFPPRYRGQGSTLILATFDVGQLAGAPLASTAMAASAGLGLPRYPALFLSTAVLLIVVGVFYARSTPSRA